MTARLVYDGTRNFSPIKEIDDFEFDADEWPLSSRGVDSLWSRIAEGKRRDG